MTDVVGSLASIAGAVIVDVRRVFFVFQDAIDVSVGALELTFADGRTIVLDAGADGESLVVSTRRWEDPFLADAMTQENRDFIAKSGKWSAVDVSESPAYAIFVDSKVITVEFISPPGGKITGAILRTAVGDLRAEVEADDLIVQLG